MRTTYSIAWHTCILGLGLAGLVIAGPAIAENQRTVRVSDIELGDLQGLTQSLRDRCSGSAIDSLLSAISDPGTLLEYDNDPALAVDLILEDRTRKRQPCLPCVKKVVMDFLGPAAVLNVIEVDGDRVASLLFFTDKMDQAVECKRRLDNLQEMGESEDAANVALDVFLAYFREEFLSVFTPTTIIRQGRIAALALTSGLGMHPSIMDCNDQ